ncbi:MAG TPA: hypothetical protein VJ917_11460, partial [Saprospiraceae bacterium]|nr:hypothetical protein [Saprospiraceae bacterium]
FLKLEPKTSFFKDIFLLIPAILFVLFSRQMFTLMDDRRGFTVTAVATILLVFFCLRNFVWDLPVNDFRPFKEGTDMAERRALEEKAMAEAPVTYPLVNKKTGEKVELNSEELTKNYKDYPSEEWEYLDQEMGEPAIPITKISEFQVSNLEGDDVTQSIFDSEGPSIMIVSYKLKGTVEEIPYTVQDTIFTVDTLVSGEDGTREYIKRFKEIVERESVRKKYDWEKEYQLPWLNTVVPFANKAVKSGLKVYSLTKLYDEDRILDFRKTVQADFPFYTADDILLKTIIRSNPGVLYIEDARIIRKWHHKQLPTYDSFREKYLKE